MKKFNHILAKNSNTQSITLIEHTEHVICSVEVFADYLGLDKKTARSGAIFHDIGKTSSVFQERLKIDYQHSKINYEPFRHELASLLFINLVDEEIRSQIIDMVVAHHKSILSLENKSAFGILDLYENREDYFELHAKDWQNWSKEALGILNYFGVPVRQISLEEAEESFENVVEYCINKKSGWSVWKGLLIGADHYASAMNYEVENRLKKAFQIPITEYYNRESSLFPLSLKETQNHKKHTLVTAPTGAGKTDFLIRRCKGRIFYTLPFQASINAMYERIRDDLAKDNPNLDLRLLHASSRLVVGKNNSNQETESEQDKQEKDLQNLIGAAIKVLTPYQMASVVFATKGFETMLLDLKNCDIILDEIHTYSDVSKAIVLKIIEVLHHFGCRLHIGTATMPSKLYNSILEILGKENVYEIKLASQELDDFDRHIIHKPDSFESLKTVLDKAIDENQKILIVSNKVLRSQEIFKQLAKDYPKTDKMLIHSRFKRKDRNQLENDLKNRFNKSLKACIVVSTQVVEVSLDINFDVMITDAAPLDALIQRFGRINRKRKSTTERELKPIYVLPPPRSQKNSNPYSLEIIQKSYEILPNGEVFKEREAQQKIDFVFDDLQTHTIEQNAKFKNEKFQLKELTHYDSSVILQTMQFDSSCCVTESDKENYQKATRDKRIEYEISVPSYLVENKGLRQLKIGNYPFVIPNKAYSYLDSEEPIGLIQNEIKN